MMISSLNLIIIAFPSLIAILAIILLVVNKPHLILYWLGLSVSLIAVNIHIMGFTFYLWRLMFVLIVIAWIVRSALGARGGFNLNIDRRYLLLFSGTIIVQTISSIYAVSAQEAFRQQLIYLSMMAVFLSVIILGTRTSDIIKALKYYLVFGIVQGLVGIYQVVGGLLGWPMYQDLMIGWTVGNARNLEGEFWFGSLMPRAFGFLSDVNHYAGYLVGVLLLAIALFVWNRRKLMPSIVLIVCSIGLMLSLSRSGIITFIIGLIVLKLLFHLAGMRSQWIIRAALIMSIVPAIFFFAASINEGMSNAIGDKINYKAVIAERVEDISTIGDTLGGSVEVHILTRLLALDAWITHPLFGVGMGVNAAPWYSEKYQEIWRGAHSHHLDALGQTGLLGACLEWLFMGLVGITMWRGLKASQKNSQERAVLVGLLTAYIAIILGNLFYHYYLNGFVWFIMGCGVALSRIVIRNSYDNVG